MICSYSNKILLVVRLNAHTVRPIHTNYSKCYKSFIGVKEEKKSDLEQNKNLTSEEKKHNEVTTTTTSTPPTNSNSDRNSKVNVKCVVRCIEMVHKCAQTKLATPL